MRRKHAERLERLKKTRGFMSEQEQPEQNDGMPSGGDVLMDIRIIVDQRGQVHLHGPLQARLMMLGAFEEAKRILTHWHEAQAKAAAQKKQREGIQLASAAELPPDWLQRDSLNGR